jgi:UDP-galactopyranose mutase
MPFNFQTIDDFYPPDAARVLKERIRAEFGGRDTATVLETLDSQDPLVSAYARFLFDSDYSLYTAKQWGISPAEIDPSVLRRVPLYFSYDDGYFSDKYQFMPEASYSALFEKLLNHPNIEVELNCEALERLGISESGDKLLIDGSETDMPVFYTGALDELFQCSDGPLPYRSLRFEWKHEDIDSFQPAAVVAYPQAEGFTRITEYKKLPVQQVAGTTYAVEYSAQYQFGGGTEPYYPVMTAESQKRYEIYRVRAGRIHNLYCCGRLADFKYYNMDQALERALDVSGGFVSSQRMN